MALNNRTPFKVAVELGYPALERQSATLAAREAFLDATTTFDADAAPMYEDDCCHYTDRGYEVLAEAIARRITDGRLTSK